MQIARSDGPPLEGPSFFDLNANLILFKEFNRNHRAKLISKSSEGKNIFSPSGEIDFNEIGFSLIM